MDKFESGQPLTASSLNRAFEQSTQLQTLGVAQRKPIPKMIDPSPAAPPLRFLHQTPYTDTSGYNYYNIQISPGRIEDIIISYYLYGKCDNGEKLWIEVELGFFEWMEHRMTPTVYDSTLKGEVTVHNGSGNVPYNGLLIACRTVNGNLLAMNERNARIQTTQRDFTPPLNFFGQQGGALTMANTDQESHTAEEIKLYRDYFNAQWRIVAD